MRRHEPEDGCDTGASRALDDDRVEKGLRVAFGESPPAGERYRSVFEDLGESTDQVARFVLVDPDDDSNPLFRPRGDHDELPAQIGRYRIAGEVARGGVGAIYKARDEDLGRDVALKVLLRDSQRRPGMTQRFLEEAQIGAQLQHPGLVPVHELGLFSGQRPYFAMKLVKGKTLGRLLAERGSPAEERLRFLGIFEQICQPLAYAHARGVIHRDLKPSNVMVGAFGEVQVMDWGLAKVLVRGGIADDRVRGPSPASVSVIETVRSGSAGGRSLAGSVFGTPAYMAPEQARGAVDDLDERADVFGLGAILCEILTGEPPYVASTVEEVHRLAKLGYLDDAMARLERSGADRDVIDLAKRCLSFEPRDRPQSAGAVAKDVRAYLDSLEERARRVELLAARTRFRATAAALVVVALGATIASYLWVDRERREALAESSVRVERAVAEARVRIAEAEAGGKGSAGWAAALEAVGAAGSLLTPGVLPGPEAELESLRRRVETEIRAAELVAEIEAIRDDALYGEQSYTLYDARYTRAFAEFIGGQIFSRSTADVIDRIGQTTARAEIVLALDDWALLRRELRRPHEMLRDIAFSIEPSSGRKRMWELIEAFDKSSVASLIRGVEREDFSASTLSMIADSLANAGFESEAEHVLRRAIEIEPESFRANFLLGRLLANARAARAQEGLQYLCAARVLHPEHKCTNLTLVRVFSAAGSWNQALRQCASALDIGLADAEFFMSCLTVLDNEMATFSTAALDRFLRAAESRARKGEIRERGWEALGAARARRAAAGNADEVLSASEADVARVGRADPYVLNMLARVRFACGDRRGAVRILEDAMAISSALPGWSRLLSTWRRELLPEIVSYASVDAALDEPEALVAEGAEWRFWRGVELPSPALEWTRSDFDDTSWESGPSGFGYGDSDDRTIVTDMQANYANVYVRRVVEIEDPARYRRFLLHVTADDGFAAYLNGELVGAARLDAENLSLAARASDAPEPVAPVVIDLSGKVRAGSNLLAIRGVNSSLESSDFSLVPELLGEPIREPAEAADRIEKFRAELESRGETALAAYLEASWLERQGDAARAAEKLRAVVRTDPRSARPFEKLWSTLAAVHGADAARPLFADELRRGLPTGLISAPLQAPDTLRAIEEERGVRLSAVDPPWHPDPRVSVAWARWQIRTEAGDYDHTPALDISIDDVAAGVLLPRHRLRPQTAYFFRASWGSDAAGVATSGEHRFITGDYPFETIAVDLSAHFDGDIVANPGDPENDPVDGGRGFLMVDGFDGRPARNAAVQGLPEDGLVGIHRLAGYDGPNAIRLAPGSGAPIRIDVAARRYSDLRFLAVGGFGDGRLPVAFIYADGTTGRGVLHVHDWFDDPGGDRDSKSGAVTPDSTPILNGMDRLFEGAFQEVNDAAVFETTLAVDARKDLVAFVLEAPELETDAPGTLVSILAVTGVWTGEEP